MLELACPARLSVVRLARLPRADRRKLQTSTGHLFKPKIYGYAIRYPSMANLGLDSNGPHRRLFWSLVVPRWICRSRLSLDSRICLASAAIRRVVRVAPQVSVRCHASLHIAMATPAPIGDMPARCCNLRSRSLLVTYVASAVAGRSCLRPLRLARISSRDGQANSIS